MNFQNLSRKEQRAWQAREDARLEALQERLRKPIKSALLDSLERVHGPLRKTTREERLELLRAWHRRNTWEGRGP